MSRDKLLTLSRRLSECEALARDLRYHQGITAALDQVQLAVARQLERLDQTETSERRPEPADPALRRRVHAKLSAWLETAGRGARGRIAQAAGISESFVSKLLSGGRVSAPYLRRLEAALNAADGEGLHQ